MKRWWTNVVKDYLSFTKKDRIGILILVLIGTACYFAPRLFAPKEKAFNKNAFANEIAKLNISIDSSRSYKNFKNYRNYDEAEYDYYRPKHYENNNNSVKGELFAFDPNTLNEEGWKRLGLRDKTIQTIKNFLAKGYKFRRPEDIKKIYGLRSEDADRLLPYVTIESNNKESSTFSSGNVTVETKKPENKVRFIEINNADTTTFISLPGIGSKLAARIVNFRDKLGGFASVQQLGETYGIPDSTFQKIKPFLQCNSTLVHTIDVNNCDVNQLKNHPYIKWNIANAIVNYRQQHGNYKNLSDLKNIDIVSEEVFNKIAPYLKVL